MSHRVVSAEGNGIPDDAGSKATGTVDPPNCSHTREPFLAYGNISGGNNSGGCFWQAPKGGGRGSTTEQKGYFWNPREILNPTMSEKNNFSPILPIFEPISRFWGEPPNCSRGPMGTIRGEQFGGSTVLPLIPST